MTSVEPELWVEHAAQAVVFYGEAFGARVLLRVGEGEDVVAQLAIDGAAFWVTSADPQLQRLSPRAIGGATGRTLLVTEDPEAVVRRATGAGATELAPVGDEHGWHLGRIRDPFGHEWEIGHPMGVWPPE